MKHIINYVRGAVILHNFLLAGDPGDDEWIEDEDDNELDPKPIGGDGTAPNYSRRDVLMHYFIDLEDTPIN